MDIKDLIDICSKITTTAVVTATALWAWYRFRRERLHKPHVGFTLACQFFGPQKDSYLAEIQITVENLGSTRQEFEHINVKIRGIDKDAELAYWRGEEPRALFPTRVVPKFSEEETEEYRIDMVHRNFSYVFVEAGVKQPLTYVTRRPRKLEIPSHPRGVQV